MRINISKLYGFISFHHYLTKSQIKSIRNQLYKPNYNTVKKFEEKFSKLIGNGQSVSFASGRMSFYVLLKILKISSNDEIMMTGFTCSVMVNAVIRIGAKPIYVDIDNNTLGTSYEDIKQKITKNTKVIVAQHSFGIPCEIEKIKNLCKKNKIFLIEDCAISLDSKVNNVSIGNFGDAAIFSTDHSKPINTLLGGLVYTSNPMLFRKICKLNDESQNLSSSRQKAIYFRILYEKKFYKPNLLRVSKKIDSILFRLNKLCPLTFPFLIDDSSPIQKKSRYPYPAKFPPFLAELGIFEIDRWKKISLLRKENLDLYIEFFKNKPGIEIPNIYFNENISITPQRMILFVKNKKIFNVIKLYFDIDNSWFKKPIISTNHSLESFGYKLGCCVNSENINTQIINLPLDIRNTELNYILNKLEIKINENIKINV